MEMCTYVEDYRSYTICVATWLWAMWGDDGEVDKSIFLPRKKKNKILLCLGSLACDRRVSEVRCYSPYVKGKEIEIPRTWDSWHAFLLNACGLPGAVLELLGDTDGMMANKK